MKHVLSEEFATIDILQRTRELYQKKEKKFEAYIDAVTAWNQKINIMSRNVSRETIREHVVHSLLPVTFGWLDECSCWVDAGTGGGLPGIPLAIQMPGTRWVLNDNIRKKIMVVQAIIDECGLKNAETEACSISLVEFQPGSGVVTKHAFKVPDLLKKIQHQDWETLIIWKGAEDIRKELQQVNIPLEAKIKTFHFGDDEVFYEGKGIVQLRPLQKNHTVKK